MEKKQPSFESNLKNLQDVVNKMESGDVPLDQAIKAFKKGVSLANSSQRQLASAKRTVAKTVDSQGQEVPYDRDRNGQDTDNNVD